MPPYVDDAYPDLKWQNAGLMEAIVEMPEDVHRILEEYEKPFDDMCGLNPDDFQTELEFYLELQKRCDEEIEKIHKDKQILTAWVLHLQALHSQDAYHMA